MVALNFLKQKASGFPKLSAKLVGMQKQRKTSSISMPKIRAPKKMGKAFDFSKYTKVAKVAKLKTTKVSTSVKKAKKVDYGTHF